MKKIISFRFNNLTENSAFQELMELIKNNKIALPQDFNPARLQKYIATNGPLSFFYGSTLINDDILSAMQKLADQAEVIKHYQLLLDGHIMNLSEKRKVLHHQVRSNNKGSYGIEQERIADFAKKVQQGEIKGSTGKPITDVVQIGIGGSDLGPRALYESLERYVNHTKGNIPIKAHFISNVDPDDANSVLDKINPEKTLFIVVSKSGTTQETLTNLEFVKNKAIEKGLKAEDLKKHFIAVTGKGSPMDNPDKYLASFYIDDYIGGRYSVTSAVGGTILSIAFGPDIFQEILDGAKIIDECAKQKNIKENLPLLDALIGIMERNGLGYANKGIIPYSKALQKFASHLQQLDCESNGKSVNFYGQSINYQTGPMIFGEPGTDSQHSYFQKIHQGSDVVPLEFIGFRKPQISKDFSFKGSTSQEKLLANLMAQITALAKGKIDKKKPADNFNGNRSTSLILADRLTPKVLGALLSHFENKVMFQGFLWNINSFDQPGVELGKKLAGEILAKNGPKDETLKKFVELIK